MCMNKIWPNNGYQESEHEKFLVDQSNIYLFSETIHPKLAYQQCILQPTHNNRTLEQENERFLKKLL